MEIAYRSFETRVHSGFGSKKSSKFLELVDGLRQEVRRFVQEQNDIEVINVTETVVDSLFIVTVWYKVPQPKRKLKQKLNK